METFDLFPTLVTKDTYSDHQKFKKIFFEKLPQYQRDDGITGEQSGNITLHHELEFEELFKYVSDTAKMYVNILIGSKDTWEPWIVKTWFSDFCVPPHDHADAHLSFVYYVNVPRRKEFPLHFLPPKDNPNDLTNGMFLPDKSIATKCVNNQYNGSSVVFSPQEGDLLMFPSSLSHVVEDPQQNSLVRFTINNEDMENRRISLAGDIILTFKEKSSRSMGLQPVTNWRTF